MDATSKTYDDFAQLRRRVITPAVNELKDKERKIITERFLIGKTQMEIAEEIGISQAQVSRLEKCGIEDLRKMIM